MAYQTKQLKKFHIQTIKNFFYQEKIGNKNILSEQTGISKTTCTTILKELLEEQFIVQIENNASTGGRPSKQYQLNKDYEHCCLMYFKSGDQMEIEIEVRNLYSEKISHEKTTFPVCTDEHIYQMTDRVFERDDRIRGIAVSIPGVIDQKRQILSCDSDELKNQNLGRMLGERYGIGVIVENDVNLAVVGCYRGEESLAFLYQPKRMYSGCGLMLNHQLYKGSTLFAGEVGYLAGCAGSQPKDRESAKKILIEQITALICIINPETIVIHSDYDIKAEEIWVELETFIEIRHLPMIRMTEGLDSYIFDGLMEAVVDIRKERFHMEDGRKV